MRFPLLIIGVDAISLSAEIFCFEYSWSQKAKMNLYIYTVVDSI